MSIDFHGTDVSLDLDDPILGIVVADLADMIRAETACTAICTADMLNDPGDRDVSRNCFADNIYSHMYTITSKRWMRTGHPDAVRMLEPLGLDDMNFVNALHVIEAEYRTTSIAAASAVREMVRMGAVDPAPVVGRMEDLDDLVRRLSCSEDTGDVTLDNLRMVVEETCRETRQVISEELLLVVGHRS